MTQRNPETKKKNMDVWRRLDARSRALAHHLVALRSPSPPHRASAAPSSSSYYPPAPGYSHSLLALGSLSQPLDPSWAVWGVQYSSSTWIDLLQASWPNH
jgi:hypothetical protein